MLWRSRLDRASRSSLVTTMASQNYKQVFQIQEQFQNMPQDSQGESLARFVVRLPQTPANAFNARATYR